MRIQGNRRRLRSLIRTARLPRLDRDELLIATAFVLGMGCLVAATTYAERRMSEITQRCHLISEEVLPPISELLYVGADLHQMVALVADAGSNLQIDQCPAVTDLRDRVGATRRRYEAMARSRQEAVAWARLETALGAVSVRSLSICARVARGESVDDALGSLHRALSRADATLGEVMASHRDRAQRDASQVVSARTRATAGAYGFIGISVGLTAALAVQAIRAVRKSRRTVELRMKELESFAARVAHDLRSPLAPPMFALQRLAARTPDDDPLRSSIVRGERSLRTIDSIVSGLFAFAASGAKPDPGASASVLDTLEAAVGEHADSASQRNVKLSLECRDHVRVACAPGVLASIAGNLIGNAIKYVGGSEQARVEVREYVQAHQARIEVIDNGPGVPAGEESRIFEPYMRCSKAGTGIGLGLATVKRLVLAHGGRVGVVPVPCRGSKFWVELPVFDPSE
jgi:signal transduction histidine kinase